MQTFYVRVEDLHATKDTIDAPESEIREVVIFNEFTPGDAYMMLELRCGGYAWEEQE